LNIGILALQGDFAEHARVIGLLGEKAREVRLPEQLGGLDGLIIPGGESTTMLKLVAEYNFRDALRQAVADGLAVMGTCAGLVLLSRELAENSMQPLGMMDITVRRNAYGRQVDSFETDIRMPVLGAEPYHAVFIRAPHIVQVGGQAEALAHLDDGTIVAARQGKLLVAAFHPELTDDTRFHKYFLDIVAGKRP
jgi:pyridoxal 5'-phosphate synthase pdxT subunit